MANELESAQTGDVFEQGGKVWRVAGFIRDPAVILHEVGAPGGQRNERVIVQRSPLAAEWARPSAERVADMLCPAMVVMAETKEAPVPCDLHAAFSRWCGHCLEVNDLTDPFDPRLQMWMAAQATGSPTDTSLTR